MMPERDGFLSVQLRSGLRCRIVVPSAIRLQLVSLMDGRSRADAYGYQQLHTKNNCQSSLHETCDAG
jgi:hypothetical protein